MAFHHASSGEVINILSLREYARMHHNLESMPAGSWSVASFVPTLSCNETFCRRVFAHMALFMLALCLLKF